MWEWLAEEPRRGGMVLTTVALAVTAAMIWFGRRKLGIAIAAALTFLFFAAIAIPGMIPSRYAAQRNTCIANLRQIREAKVEWASSNNKSTADIPVPADLFGTNAFIRNRPVCPRGGTYAIGAVGENPACSLAAKKHKLD